MVEQRSWDGQLIWRYTYNTPDHRMHHDIAPLPNGNVIIVAWEFKSLADAADMGKDTSTFDGSSVWPDHIIEVEPVGIDSGNIVWEWHAWDHLVQDFDPSKPNFDVISDRPERININYDPQNTDDWFHVNSIDYNPALDQIMISVPHFDEIWIIDHSTTTAQASGSTGGNSDKGGDLLYRWGNPKACSLGATTDQKLFFQHDARWVVSGIPNDPDSGNIMVFNNRVGVSSSRVDMFAPPIDTFGQYIRQPNVRFGPDTLIWSYEDPVPSSLYSDGLSGAHKLPNGNFLVNSGQQGRIFEITRAGQITWEYKVPLLQGQPVAQGTLINQNILNFRSVKYPADHPFLTSQDLTPIGYLELEPDSTFCGSFNVSIAEILNSGPLPYPNPTTGPLNVISHGIDMIRITDVVGRIVLSASAKDGLNMLNISSLPQGTYWLNSGLNGIRRPVVKY